MTPRAATRGVLVAAALVAALDLALVGATRLALSSDWLPAGVNASPESLFVTWTAPRVSLLPGRIGFGSVTIRNRDPNVEFEARLTDVTMRVALLDLPARVFRVSAVRAGSLAFRLRERLTRAEATPARLARYPAIAGFPDAPLLGSPPLHVLESRSWRVHLTDLLVGEVSEIWIGSWRWTGKARVAGGFFLESGARAEVFPSGLEVESGTLAWGPESVSRETRGSVRARLPRFDTQAYPGNDVWKIVSGSADLAGSLDRLTFLSPDGDPAVSGGGGAVRIAVRLDGGRGSARLDASASPRASSSDGCTAARGCTSRPASTFRASASSSMGRALRSRT
jgi:hypothetical protein